MAILHTARETYHYVASSNQPRSVEGATTL